METPYHENPILHLKGIFSGSDFLIAGPEHLSAQQLTAVQNYGVNRPGVVNGPDCLFGQMFM